MVMLDANIILWYLLNDNEQMADEAEKIIKEITALVTIEVKADYNPRDGYVYSQSVRGADAEFKAWVLKGDHKTEKLTDDGGRGITFTHKSRIHPKTIQVRKI